LIDLNQIKLIVWFIIPGFITASVKSFLLPTLKKTDFVRFIESIIFSFINIAITSSVFFVVWKLGLKRASNHLIYKENDYLFIIENFIVAVSSGIWVSLILKSNVYKFFLLKVGINYSVWPSVWNDVMQIPNGGWIRIHTKQGLIYGGALVKYSVDPNIQQQAIFLKEACYLDEDGYLKEEIKGEGVYISESEIQSVEFINKA
jgi:hypothetical protein